MTAIMSAFTVTGISTAIEAALVLLVALNLAFLGYKYVKKAANRA